MRHERELHHLFDDQSEWCDDVQQLWAEYDLHGHPCLRQRHLSEPGVVHEQ
jgi:hypothetical protein